MQRLRGWEDLSRMMEVYERLNKNITKEVVGQYIQHERISVEFAEYYELYQKYQQDYQIAEILKGKPSEAMVKKVSHAPFDERVSVVNLLFSGVRQAVREVVLQEEVLEKVFEILKLLKEPQEGGKLLERLGDYVDNLRMEREQKQKEGLLERREDPYDPKGTPDLLENYRLLLKKGEWRELGRGFRYFEDPLLEKHAENGKKRGIRLRHLWNAHLILWRRLFITARKW